MVEYIHWSGEQNRTLQETKTKMIRGMDLYAKSELFRTLIKTLELPKGSSLPDPTTFIRNDVTGSPQYVHAFEQQMNGDAVQAFEVCISKDSVTLRCEYSTACSFSGCGHIEKAVEDVGRFLKRGCDLPMEQVV
jgi:hypothetical protein